MPSLPDGMKRAIFESISGIISYIFLVAIFEGFKIPFAAFFVNIISIILLISLFDKMTYWSMTYTIGWIAGFCLIGRHIIGPLELILSILIGGIALYIKLKNKF